MVTAADVVDALTIEPSGTKGFELLACLLRDAPQEAEAFVMSVLADFPKGGTSLDMALSHIPESAFGRIVPAAIERLGSSNSRGACESVIARASLQQLQALHPHLPRLFELRPNQNAYYEHWPWREAGPGALPFLSEQLDARRPDDLSQKAWECLLELRIPEAFALAEASCDQLQLDYPMDLYLKEVGYDLEGVPLYREQCMHMIFDTGYFTRERPVWSSRALHPTWRLEIRREQLRFGGAGASHCGLCAGQLHHLLTAPAKWVFPDAPAPGSIVMLETCLSCLGWERGTLYYHHGNDGVAVSLDSGPVTPQFPGTVLREATIDMAVTPRRWRWQDWALSNGRENLNRFGGYPSWIQSADFPNCPGCEQTMHFLIQLDSDLPTADGGEWLWGSGGICYGFRCEACRNTAFLWQCT